MIVRAPAADIASRIGPWVGTIAPLDEASCVLTLGLLGADFTVSEPRELVAQLRVLAARYAAAVAG